MHLLENGYLICKTKWWGPEPNVYEGMIVGIVSSFWLLPLANEGGPLKARSLPYHSRLGRHTNAESACLHSLCSVFEQRELVSMVARRHIWWSRLRGVDRSRFSWNESKQKSIVQPPS